MNYKKPFICSLLLSICIYISLPCLSAFGDQESEAPGTISTGMCLPQFTLDAPESAMEQKYLGLSELKAFSPSQISAKIIVLEIFSVFCPHCRLQAPELNKIYSFIKQDSNLSDGIKMVGIAAGAGKSQVEVWKTTLHVPFPLFPDQEAIIWKQLGKPGIPCTLLVSGNGKVLAAHFGPTENAEDLFRQIKELYNEQK